MRIPILAVAGLTLLVASAHAQDNREKELERQLQERDRVISELLQRVEALERRVGVQPPTEGSPTATEQATAPADEQGAAQGDSEPGAVVVDEAAAERALERSLTSEGALLLPPGIVEVEPGISYARQEDRTPTFVTSGGTVFPGETERNVNNLTGDLALRLGLPWDSQLELGIPYRWRNVETVTNVGFTPIDSSTDSDAGFGDLRVGLAKTLFREGLWRPDLVARLTWDTDTGSTGSGGLPLGSGFNEVRASLSAIKRQDPIAFVGGLSYEYAFEKDSIQPGATFGANFGSFIALSPETSVRFQLSGGYQERTELSGSEVLGSDRTLGTFIVGSSTLLAPGTLLNLSAGIGLTDDADDFSIILSLPIRFDGPLY